MKVRFLRDYSPYSAGETEDLPRTKAISLIRSHIAEEDRSVEALEIEHKGSGWYELPNGKKVRGKEEALREVNG